MSANHLNELISELRSLKSEHRCFVPSNVFDGFAASISVLNEESQSVVRNYMSDYSGVIVVSEPLVPSYVTDKYAVERLRSGICCFPSSPIFFKGGGSRRIEDIVPESELHRVDYVSMKLSNFFHRCVDENPNLIGDWPVKLKGLDNLYPGLHTDAHLSFDDLDGVLKNVTVEHLNCVASESLKDVARYASHLGMSELTLHSWTENVDRSGDISFLEKIKVLNIQEVAFQDNFYLLEDVLDEGVFPNLEILRIYIPGGPALHNFKKYCERDRPSLTVQNIDNTFSLVDPRNVNMMYLSISQLKMGI